MDEEVRRSRLRVSRRRALGLGGTVGLAGVLAACGTSTSSSATSPATTTTATSATPVADDIVAMLDRANTCGLTKEETQGPYWFDVDAIRTDVRENRPGAALNLVLRVQDVTGCVAGTAGTPVPNAVVEIWHCDAGGVYSGFESGSQSANGGGGGGGGQGGPPPGSQGGPPPGDQGGAPPGGGGGGMEGDGEEADGSYAAGDTQATTTDDGTYLRGAQVADARGIVSFTTIYPGWYTGRTVHIHTKVHLNRATVLTSQLYFDDAYSDAVHATAPYSSHTGRDTRNDTDGIYDASGLMIVQPSGDGHLALLNLGVDV